MPHNFKQSLGASGEQQVVQHLEQEGFTILATNYRWLGGELDVVAQKNELVVMVEVKTRTQQYVAIAEMVSYPKQQKIIATARHFLANHRLPNTIIRFDVACIIADTLTYIPNAFTPTERYGY